MSPRIPEKTFLDVFYTFFIYVAARPMMAAALGGAAVTDLGWKIVENSAHSSRISKNTQYPVIIS